MEKTAEKNSEQTVEKQPETDSLVVTRSYGTRQQPPMDDLHVRGIADWRANGFLCAGYSHLKKQGYVNP